MTTEARLTGDESWVWIDRMPTTEDMLERLESLPALYGIKAVDYADFVLPLETSQKFKTEAGEEYKPTVRLYMQVAGRVRMLADAQENHSWSVVETQELLVPDPPVLRMGISIQSPDSWKPVEADSPEVTFVPYVQGQRYGTASWPGGKKAWENMETAARGRAIGAWGFGVLPGSGIATLEEMQLALTPGVTQQERADKRERDEIVQSVRAEIVHLGQLRGQDESELDGKLSTWIDDRLGVKAPATEKGLNLDKLKDGQLLLLEKQVRVNIREEELRQSEI